MRTAFIFSLIIVSLLSTRPGAAQHRVHDRHAGHSASEAAAECVDKVIPYSDWSPEEEPTWTLILDPAKTGALYFYGASHSDDISDPQFDEIEAAYEAFQPTIVFYEGPVRPLGDTMEETIEKYGESGFVRFLADRDGLSIARLEPDPVSEMQYILESFSIEQAMLFYVLREASRFRERKEMSVEEIHQAIAQLLQRASGMMETPIKTVEDLDAAYRRHWTEPEHWWQAPAEWFQPSSADVVTGGNFTNAINRASSHFRNLNMYRVLTEAALDGERVFAVVGRNHVPMQAGALRCALSK